MQKQKFFPDGFRIFLRYQKPGFPIENSFRYTADVRRNDRNSRRTGFLHHKSLRFFPSVFRTDTGQEKN